MSHPSLVDVLQDVPCVPGQNSKKQNVSESPWRRAMRQDATRSLKSRTFLNPHGHVPCASGQLVRARCFLKAHGAVRCRAECKHPRGHVQQRAPGVRHAVAVLLVFRRRVHRLPRHGRRHAIYAARRCRPKPGTGGCGVVAPCAGQLGCRCAKINAIQNVRPGAARHNLAQVYVAMQLGGHRSIAHRPPARGAGKLGGM
eukprot:361242-Chlamydomonas_euryale.AAC.2